jgi:glyoxylase-like metal-dependent hydrolase (beta-lactamase superfamily II)
MVNSFRSRHFNLEQLADGVYAAIHAEEGWAICNAGIIDLGDRTLVYDSFMSPQAASDLRRAAEILTGHPVHLLINSHPHNDHIWGNQAFGPDVDILSSNRTRELIITEGPLEIQSFRDVAQTRLEATQEQFAMSCDEITRYHLRVFTIYFQAILATLPILQIRLPNLTFKDELSFYGSRRSARLIAFDGAHSGNDAILHLPDDGIVFMSDLLFIGGHPYLLDGDPEKIMRILAEVRKLQVKIFVPGHGPVGQAVDLDGMDEYINTLNALVREAINQGVSADEIDKIAMPGKYQHLIFPTFFPENLKYLYQRQIKSESSLTGEESS